VWYSPIRGPAGMILELASSASAVNPSFAALLDDGFWQGSFRQVWDCAVAPDALFVTMFTYRGAGGSVEEPGLARYSPAGVRQAVVNPGSQRVVVADASGPVYTFGNSSLTIRDRSTLAPSSTVTLSGQGYDIESLADAALGPESNAQRASFWLLGRKGADVRVQQVTVQGGAVTQVATLLATSIPAGESPVGIAIDNLFFYVLWSAANSRVRAYRRVDGQEVASYTHPSLGRARGLALARGAGGRQLIILGENTDPSQNASGRLFLVR